MSRRMPQNLSDELSKFQDNDLIFIKPCIRNLTKQDISTLSVDKIKNKLEEIFFNKNLKDIEIIKIEFRTASADVDLSGRIIETPGFNNYLDVPFLKELLSGEQLQYELPESLQEENQELTFTEQTDPEDVQISVIDAKKRKVKVNKLQEVANFMKLINIQLKSNNSRISQLQYYQIDDGQIDPVADSPLTVVLRLQKKHIADILNLPIQLKDNRQPAYLNFERAVILNKDIQYIDFSTKMGKKPLKLTDLDISYVMGQYLGKPEMKAIENVTDIQLQLTSFFNSKMLPYVSMTLYYHREDSLLSRKVEFIITFPQFLFKIEIDLASCQYVHAISDDKGKKLYFKLLSPALYSISLFSKRKYEMFNIKQDWIRVDNVFANAHYEKYQNEIERLVMISNTVIVASINFQEKSREEFDYKCLLNNLKQYKLLLEFEDYDLYFEKKERDKKFDEIENKLKIAKISFELKYGLLCLVAQNRITELNYLELFIKKMEKEQNDIQKNEKLFEATFQSFMRFSTNLNFSTRISDLNIKNYLTFERDYKRLKEELIISSESLNMNLAYIKRVSLTPSGYLYNLKLPEETSIIIRQHYQKLNYFIRMHFEDENLETIHGLQYITDYFYRDKLKVGINLFDEKYKLLTWSASQLRGGSCWLFNFNRAKISRQQFIDQIGNFQNLSLDQVAKNAARLGQGFSSSKSIVFQNLFVDEILQDKKDKNDKLYTDGIGQISADLIKQIRIQLQNQLISAIQIRLHGAKGILLINNDLPKNTIKLRKSMIKYGPSLCHDGKYQNTVALLDYNKFRGGYLNRQIIILLVTLGIQDEIFIELQNYYIKQIEGLTATDSSIYKHFLVDYNGELQGLPSIIENMRAMINVGLNEKNNIYINKVLNRLKRRGLMQLRTKCNILMEKAARVLGVVDDYDILEEGEIVCLIRENQDKIPFYLEGDVIVTRNPCLHPGDIRKVRALSRDEIVQRSGTNPYEQYYNCIVFPCKGDSIPAQCGGGDLDGDIYFVSWDERIIPKKIEDPMNYDEEKKPQTAANTSNQVGYRYTEDFFSEEKMIEFILQYLNYDVLGKIDNSHLAIADRSIDYAKDRRCLQLAKLHSAAVDYVKHGFKVDIRAELQNKEWPDFMEKESNAIYKSTSILGKLYRDVLNLMKEEVPTEGGYKQIGLPEIDDRFIYNYLEVNELAQEDNDNESINKYYEEYESQYLKKEYCQAGLKCLNHIFESFDSLFTMYELTDEYEIYCGYYTNFTKGEGTRLKRKLNIENVQKRIILNLIQLKEEITRILQKCDDQLAVISIMHFFMMYSPLTEIKNKYLKIYVEKVLHAIQSDEKSQYNFSRLQIRFPKWYRGCTWFFFTQQILSFNQKSQLQKPDQQLQDEDEFI